MAGCLVAQFEVEAVVEVAQQFLDQTGSLRDARISVERRTDTVTVTVTGTAWSPQPFIDPQVTVTLTAPVERVIE